MYRRYQPGAGTQPGKQGKPTAGEMEKMQKQPQRQRQVGGGNQQQRQGKAPEPKPQRKEKRKEGQGNPVLNMIPPALYNRETGKVLGFLSAEDLLIVALIFLLLESKEAEDSLLVYLLLYILISDYIELPF